MNLITVSWLVVTVIAVWPLQQWWLKTVLDGAMPDKMDIMFSVVLGCLAAVLWPVWAFMFIAFKVSKGLWFKFLGNDDERIPVD